MSDPVLITLLIVVAILVVLFLYRKQLKSFFFEGGGVKTGMETHKPADPAKSGATMQVGNVSGSRVRNEGGGGGADLTAQDITDSTVTNTNRDP